MNAENMETCVEILESLFVADEEDPDAVVVDKGTINTVVFVGGSAAIPKLQEMVKGFMQDSNPNFAKIKYLNEINADEVVALGAAWQADYLLPSEYSKEFFNE